jgi:hypothetical protein
MGCIKIILNNRSRLNYSIQVEKVEGSGCDFSGWIFSADFRSANHDLTEEVY